MTDDLRTMLANAELADWIEAAALNLPNVRPGDGAWLDRITNLADHIRAGRVGDPRDAFGEIETEG